VLAAEYEGTNILLIVRKHSTNSIASHPRRLPSTGYKVIGSEELY